MNSEVRSLVDRAQALVCRMEDGFAVDYQDLARAITDLCMVVPQQEQHN